MINLNGIASGMRDARRFLLVVLAWVVASSVQAAALEELIVTAQKREQNLQDVPISVNAIGGEKMAEAGITEIEDMTAYVPNLTMNETGIGTNIAIRGISSGINQGFEQSVGMYVDGIYYGRAQLARAPFMDLERVEVLRGPQSILFGKNSIAGAVSMITAKPTQEFEGSVTALYEPDHGEVDGRLVLSGPLSETVSARLALLVSEFDGYVENTTLGRDEPEEEELVIRGSVQWDISDELTANLKIESGTFDAEGRFIEIVNPVELTGGTPYAAVLNNFGISLDTEQDFKRQSNGDFSENDVDNITLNIEYAIGDHTLNLVSGYAAYEYEELCDCDFVGATIFDVLTTEDFDQFSQEIRLTSPGLETLDYIVGAFYQTNELNFTDGITVPTNSILPLALAANPALAAIAPQLAGTASNRTFNQESDLWSVFAQVTWNVSDVLRLTLGGRYTSEDKEADRRQFHVDATGTDVGLSNPILNTLYGLFRIEPYDEIAQSQDEAKFTPLVTVQWDATTSAMLYATYTTGFKAGGFDVRSNAHPDPSVMNATRLGAPLTGTFLFGDEEAESFEIGGKFSIGDSAELNVAIFNTVYEDLQTSQFDGTLGFNVTNAGEATVRGIELDGRWQMTDEFLLTGAVAYLDFEYDKFPNAQCFFGQTPDSTSFPGLCDVAGQRREFTPEYSATLSGSYNVMLSDTLELRASLDLIYTDEYLASPTLDPKLPQDSYVKLNARIAVGPEEGTWELALIGKNLTDEEVLTFGNTAPLSTFFTSGTGAAYYGFFDRPTSVAIQGAYRF